MGDGREWGEVGAAGLHRAVCHSQLPSLSRQPDNRRRSDGWSTRCAAGVVVCVGGAEGRADAHAVGCVSLQSPLVSPTTPPSAWRRLSPRIDRWLWLRSTPYIWHWHETFRSLLMMTARSFSISTHLSCWLFMKYKFCSCGLPMCMTLHLDTLNSIFHSSNHWHSFWRSPWSLSLSLSSLIWLNIFVSSTNFKIQLLMPTSRSFI